MTPRPPRRALCALLLLLALAAPACGEEVQGGAILPPLQLTEVGPSPIVPGTRLTLRGAGFVVPEVATLAVVFRGAVDGEGVEFAVLPRRISDDRLELAVEGEVERALVREHGRFVGTVSVLRTPLIDAPADEARKPVELYASFILSPRVDDLSPKTLYLGEHVVLRGDGFLHPSEGASIVELDGVMVSDSPPRSLTIHGLQLPAAPEEADRRDTLAFTLTPDVLGIIPGRFDGTVTVIDAHRNGAETRSAPLALAGLSLAAPRVDELTPLAASRGQWITVTGQGFTAADGLLQTATVLELAGTFRAASGAVSDLTGTRALTLVPDLVLGNDTLSAVLRVTADGSGQLSGVGAVAGRFTGTASTLLLFGADAVRGQALPVTFDVLPQRQMVYLKLLPGFEQALAEFGLLAEKDAVVDRILAVLARDYQGINIVFSTTVPEDFAEYSVVEIAGRDPNGTKLFGLDNTAGKDVGNLRFNDIIGGYNAETEENGYVAYGGVFPGEFRNLSPTLGDDNPLASPAFDDVFRPVMPELGGTPAAPGESSASDGRGAAIREAVRVFGNLVGNTVTHEVGHSLGLAAVDGQFHNLGDNPGWIMDAGANRPFEERAEIGGAGPAVFSPFNREYLESILPIE